MKQKTTNKKNPKAKATKEKTRPAPPRNAADLTTALDKLKPTPQQLLEGQAEALQSIAKESAPTVKQLAYISTATPLVPTRPNRIKRLIVFAKSRLVGVDFIRGRWAGEIFQSPIRFSKFSL